MPHRVEATGSLTAGHQLPTPGPGSAPTTLPEGIDGVPIIVDGQIIGWNIGGEFFTQAEVDSLIATGSFPEEPTTAGAGPSFASTQAGVQQAFTNDQSLLAQRHENELAQLNAQLASASGINAQNIQAQIDLENLRHENDL
ncbi:hypothetical protein LCGC14_2038940, partial [marine sediment metagenome]